MEPNLQQEQKAEQKTRPILVQRRAGLRGLFIGAARAPVRTIRRNTRNYLKERDPGIPYVRAGTACRNLVFSLMDRQDRMNRKLPWRIVNLPYRMNDHEAFFSVMREGKPASFAGVPP
jgi:hypothetical protein